jgi:hypothetical protein
MMRCSVALACRSPPRLSLCRWVLPDEAGTGLAPQRAAKAASDRSRCGLSPAVVSSVAALLGPTPEVVSKPGAVTAVSRWVGLQGLGLGAQGEGAPCQQAQGVFGRCGRGIERAGTQCRAAVQKSADGQIGQALAQRRWGGDQHALELVDRLGARLDRGVLGHLQHADHFHSAPAGLGDAGCPAGMDGPGGHLRVDGVAFPHAVAGGAVGPVDLHDLVAVVGEMAGEPGTVGPGALRPEHRNRAEIGGPSFELPIAGGVRRDAELPQTHAWVVQPDRHVDVFVSVDPDRDPVAIVRLRHAVDGCLRRRRWR